MEASEIYGSRGLSSARYLKNNIKEDDLIWTRDAEGNYYLGKVASEWEYFSSPEAQDADIVNIVRYELHTVPSVDDVPGKVVACFRPARTIQAVRCRLLNLLCQQTKHNPKATLLPLSEESVKTNFVICF